MTRAQACSSVVERLNTMRMLKHLSHTRQFRATSTPASYVTYQNVKASLEYISHSSVESIAPRIDNLSEEALQKSKEASATQRTATASLRAADASTAGVLGKVKDEYEKDADAVFLAFLAALPELVTVSLFLDFQSSFDVPGMLTLVDQLFVDALTDHEKASLLDLAQMVNMRDQREIGVLDSFTTMVRMLANLAIAMSRPLDAGESLQFYRQWMTPSVRALDHRLRVLSLSPTPLVGTWRPSGT